MLNQLVLVGRTVDDIKKEKMENEREYVKIVLAVPRNFKNDSGVYETDFISCFVFGNLINSVINYCKKGDLVGVKGRIENINGSTPQVIAERITFLDSNLDSKKREDD